MVPDVEPASILCAGLTNIILEGERAPMFCCCTAGVKPLEDAVIVGVPALVSL